jgi:hypothetical protein
MRAVRSQITAQLIASIIIWLASNADRKWHWHCFLRMAWRNRRETYVFGELGGFWHWMAWWPTTLKEYVSHYDLCGYCETENLPHNFLEKVKSIFYQVPSTLFGRG